MHGTCIKINKWPIASRSKVLDSDSVSKYPDLSSSTLFFLNTNIVPKQTMNK